MYCVYVCVCIVCVYVSVYCRGSGVMEHGVPHIWGKRDTRLRVRRCVCVCLCLVCVKNHCVITV